MRIKQKPEDFSVKESYRFDEVPDGAHRVYLMDKQKLSTFDAIDRLKNRFGLRPGQISYCGLKDKQGRTEQIIAVDGADVESQDPDLRLRQIGRTDKKLSAANITSNRFSVTVRSLSESDLGPLNLAVAEVNRLGVVNYFDSQRFGSLKHGQGFIAKDLIRGDFEAALKNFLAKPSPLDQSEDAKVKEFWRMHWGQWDQRVPYEGVKKYFRILESLRRYPGDYVRAFLQIDKDYRAMQLFTYQSYLWNEGVRRYLQLLLPREHLFPVRYQAGTILFHRDASGETLDALRKARFPLLAPQSTFEDPKVDEAVKWVLGKEKLKLEELRIEESPKLLFFKHEERPLIVFPQKLVIGRVQPDELNRGDLKVNVAFTLPPGAYATLVIKRLFHTTWEEETVADIKAQQAERHQRRLEREEREEAGEYGELRIERAPSRGREAAGSERIWSRDAERSRFPARAEVAERSGPPERSGGPQRAERGGRSQGRLSTDRGGRPARAEAAERGGRGLRSEPAEPARLSRGAPSPADSAIGRLKRAGEPVAAPRDVAAPVGFRERQRASKAAKEAARERTESRSRRTQKTKPGGAKKKR